MQVVKLMWNLMFGLGKMRKEGEIKSDGNRQG